MEKEKVTEEMVYDAVVALAENLEALVKQMKELKELRKEEEEMYK